MIAVSLYESPLFIDRWLPSLLESLLESLLWSVLERAALWGE
jgi:hypothetical protein